MPHIHLEVSTGVKMASDYEQVLCLLVRRLSEFDTVSPASIKAYMTERQLWVMGEGAPRTFLHCTVSLLSGRSLELRRFIGEAMRRALLDQLLEQEDVAVSVEIREMDQQTYFK